MLQPRKVEYDLQPFEHLGFDSSRTRKGCESKNSYIKIPSFINYIYKPLLVSRQTRISIHIILTGPYHVAVNNGPYRDNDNRLQPFDYNSNEELCERITLFINKSIY
jgi:hypothetical protein